MLQEREFPVLRRGNTLRISFLAIYEQGRPLHVTCYLDLNFNVKTSSIRLRAGILILKTGKLYINKANFKKKKKNFPWTVVSSQSISVSVENVLNMSPLPHNKIYFPASKLNNQCSNQVLRG